MDRDPDEPEDRLRRAAAGDQAALGALWERHRARLRQMVRLRLDRRLQGRVDPSDVLQDADLDLAARRPDSARDRPMPTDLWLRPVTGQRLDPVHRPHRGAPRDASRAVRLDRGAWPQASSASLPARRLGRFTTASQAATRAERQLRLQEVLNDLDPIDREILALRHFEQLTNDEAAQVLGLFKTAADNRYVRALGRLRDLLGRVPGFLDQG
jgi:RNA polymerase sigma-70 factor (ECF subfamily)